MSLFKAIISCFLFISVNSCNNLANKGKTVKHYNLDKPDKFFMPESLLEISGITFYKGKRDTVYAIQDEQGRLFRLAWDVKKQYNAKFGKQSDYEDVAIINDQVLILKSNGTLFSFPFGEAIYEEVNDVKEWKKLLPKGEYEGMHGDEDGDKLYIICKNCPEDNSKNFVTGYILRIADPFYVDGTFRIDVNEIKKIAGKVKRGFRPSAMAKNPVTGEWFIVSAVNKLLVVTDSAWKVKEACPLNSNTFNQPEGIAFDAQGNLYISNEGDDLSEGDILRFTRSKQEDKVQPN